MRLVAVCVTGSVLTVGCASGDDATVESTTQAATSTTEAPTTTLPEGFSTFPHHAALLECFTLHGIDARFPPQPQARITLGSFPREVSEGVWDACRDIYLEAVRESIAGFNPTGSPSEPEALAFADCMATLGWVTSLGPGSIRPVVEDLSEYTEANAACRTPVAGESVAASYCRFVQAIFDRATHDSSMSITGIPSPFIGTDESRREAAVALYDEALGIAPDDLVDDLHTLQDGFRQGNQIPEAAWEPMIDYHMGVCGVWVYLGALD